MKDNSFARFFNPSKSKKIHESIPKGKLLWDSQRKGTYVRAKHGELK